MLASIWSTVSAPPYTMATTDISRSRHNRVGDTHGHEVGSCALVGDRAGMQSRGGFEHGMRLILKAPINLVAL